MKTNTRKALDKERRLRARKIGKLILPAYDVHDACATLTDTLADLRHFADHYGLDFADCERRAYAHYTAEIEGDDIAIDAATMTR